MRRMKIVFGTSLAVLATVWIGAVKLQMPSRIVQ